MSGTGLNEGAAQRGRASFASPMPRKGYRIPLNVMDGNYKIARDVCPVVGCDRACAQDRLSFSAVIPGRERSERARNPAAHAEPETGFRYESTFQK